MQRVTVLDIEPADVRVVVGATSYQRGMAYALSDAVLSAKWDPERNALHGQVEGRSLYEATAYFGTGVRAFEYGECSCPVGFNCKHVAALVLTAAQETRRPASPPRAAAARKPPSWERSLSALIGSRPGERSGTALGIELSLTTLPNRGGGSSWKVTGRLVQRKQNGWTYGYLSWTQLGSLHHDGYNTAHIRVLQDLYALHRALETSNGGYYSYGDVKTIDFTRFRSRQLWPLLAEAEALGLRLTRSRKAGGDVPHGSARISLDVSHGDKPGSLAVSPAIEVDGTRVDALPLLFIGDDGHGLIYVEDADAEAAAGHTEWPLRLAELTQDTAPALQQMVLSQQRLKVPASAASRFRDEFYPRLRHIAPVTSSDEAFTPPEISDPTLTLHATYGDDHVLDLDWEWVYEIGDSQVRTPLSAEDDDGYRDLDRERAILADLDFELGDPRTELADIETMRFTTEILPLLREQSGVAVEVTGSPADYREAGDSLTIGVSTGELAGETDWFDLGVSITVEGKEVPFVSVFTALATDQSHLLLADGAYFSLGKPELQALRKLIEEARALQDTPGGELRISRYQVGLWDELAALGVVDRQAEAWQRQLKALRSIDSVGSAEPPSTLDAQLRPYQVDGFRWLAFLWEFRLGGILADDMGLGKTLQALALICHAKQDDPGVAPFLIIAPTSVVSNWAAESARFAPDLAVVSIVDTMRRRGSTIAETIAGADLVVTSHTLFRLDFDEYSAQPWAGLVMDEAQFAKNHQSKLHQCARRLAAPVKLAITGTPMENNLMELWSLLSITAPGLFPSPTRFTDYYARPIEKAGNAELLAQLRNRIKPLVKRRTKEQVAADLPPKQEQVLEVELAPRHRKIYQTHLQRERQKVLGLIDDMNKNRFEIFRSLTLLRQLSLHAGLVDEKHLDLPCAKIDTLLEQLGEVVDGGHRALVFSQFTGFLALVREQLDAAGVPYCYLDGKTRNRPAVLSKFKEGEVPVFLISLKAGGFGLNLTEADYCFLLDPWWNPATEAQAVDRTHRIGQTRNVMVYRLIAKGTIEEKVMELKARKAKLFASVMDDGNAFGGSLNADDVRGLFA